MKLRIVMLTLTAAVAGAWPAEAQAAPQCRSLYDFSSLSERMFEVFTDSTIADYRARIGIVTQSGSAPHGVLTVNDECEALRHATLRLLAARGETLPRATDMSFFVMGTYYGVFVNRPVDPKDPVVSGVRPFYVFMRAPTDSTRHSTAVGAHSHKLRFVTELAF